MTNNNNNTNSHDGIPAYELTEAQCFDRMDWALRIIEDANESAANKYIAKRALKHVQERLYVLTVGESTQQTIERMGA
jgi:hypothetical protein